VVEVVLNGFLLDSIRHKSSANGSNSQHNCLGLGLSDYDGHLHLWWCFRCPPQPRRDHGDSQVDTETHSELDKHTQALGESLTVVRTNDGPLENRDLGATLDALLDIPELEKAGFPEDLHALVQELEYPSCTVDT
jgi:hypothetical protein